MLESSACFNEVQPLAIRREHMNKLDFIVAMNYHIRVEAHKLHRA
jgi:hypothetical protein